MADKTVDLQVPINVLEKMLEKAFIEGKHPYAKLLAETIIGNLNTTELGLSQIITASMGMKETTKWVVGDEAMIALKDIYAWGTDKDLMKTENMLHKGHIKGVIEEIDLHKRRGVVFSFKSVNKDSTSGVITQKEDRDSVRITDLKTDEDLILKRPHIASML